METEGNAREHSYAQAMEECVEKLISPDYIMEPGVFQQLKRFLQLGGTPREVVALLSGNYKAVAQMTNLLAEWLMLAGFKATDVQAIFENHLKEMISKTFDPKKADTIFTERGKIPVWLTEMIHYPTWHSLIFRLAEEYPDCLMLRATIKLISKSDAGFHSEIASTPTTQFRGSFYIIPRR